MFNDLTSAATLFASRRSGKARDMTAPGPDQTQLTAILASAMRVPDHGKLCPWRFVLITDREPFATLLTSAYLREKPTAGRLEIEAMDSFARQAPVMIALLSTPIIPHKIPLWEQQLSAGAAAMQLLNAAHAHGFVGNWLTGWPANNAEVAASLGCRGSEDRVAGYFFIGTAVRELEERPRPQFTDIVSQWAG